MNNPFILKSFLDNDFYKFTMQNAVMKLFPYARARYRFINRGKHEFPEGFADLLREAIDNMSVLKLIHREKIFLEQNCPYLDPTYIDFLEGYRYNPEEVKIMQKGSDLSLYIEGLWYRTILWEVPLMAIVSELYYEAKKLKRKENKEIIASTLKKIKLYEQINVPVAEFGTRRRHSYEVHSLVVKSLKERASNYFAGSSNVHFSHLFDLKPIGTHSHEWFMFHGAKYGFKTATNLALEHWAQVYRGDLGIALSDTYTSKAFFRSFDKKLAKLFDGIRHDSGDPIEFAKNAINHYERLRINPMAKTIIFSDSLDPEKVSSIAKFCKGKINTSFGIGTNFTNDVGLPPLNIVIKMIEALPEKEDWTPVVKLSDVEDKISGTPEMIQLAKNFLNI